LTHFGLVKIWWWW